MDICSSPWLIAACHVLLRLPMPRHSPYALLRLNYLKYTISDMLLWFSFLMLELLCFILAVFGKIVFTHSFHGKTFPISRFSFFPLLCLSCIPH